MHSLHPTQEALPEKKAAGIADATLPLPFCEGLDIMRTPSPSAGRIVLLCSVLANEKKSLWLSGTELGGAKQHSTEQLLIGTQSAAYRDLISLD